MTVHHARLPSGLDPLTLMSGRLPSGVIRSDADLRFFWAAPDTGVAVAGLGCAAEIRADGLDAVLQRLGAHAPSRSLHRDPLGRGAIDEGAPAMVVLPFDPLGFRDARRRDPRWGSLGGVRVFVPEVCVVAGPSETKLSVAWPDEPAARLRDRAARIADALPGEPVAAAAARHGGASETIRLREPERDALRERIATCVREIQRGRAHKVVLSTSHTTSPPARPDPMSMLAGRRSRDAQAFRYLVQPSRTTAWLGASPERLIEVSGCHARTVALAGSTARHSDPDLDRANGDALLGSVKDRAEHQWVVDALVESLGPVADEIMVPAAPALRRLDRIQHLETPIEARLKQHVHVLELAGMLQPTPALGGAPRDAALALIRALEPLDRGWYGGAVGWFDADGNGDVTVAIRSVLLHGQHVTAFAGAGIVADSDPDAEVLEIELKLGSVMQHLR